MLSLRRPIRLFFSSLLVLILFPMMAAAAPNALIFGPEWTFTNESLVSTNYTATSPEFIRLKSKIRLYCAEIKGCEYSEWMSGVYAVMDFKGFRVQVSYDPGVIEVQSTPLSQKEWQEKLELVQKHVFDFMAQAGYKPHGHIGNGHLNIGLQYFADKPKLLRNFIVDYYNHPGLAIVLNTYHENLKNAQTFDLMPPEKQEQFLEAIRQLDAIPNYTIGDVIEKLAPILSGGQNKFVSLGLRDISTIKPGEAPEILDQARMEVRSLRPQADMRDFQRIIKIFESRIQYLQTLKEPLPLRPPATIRDGFEAMWQYADYLEQAKLKIKDFVSLVPEVWRQMPRSQFVQPYIQAPSVSCKEAHAHLNQQF